MSFIGKSNNHHFEKNSAAAIMQSYREISALIHLAMGGNHSAKASGINQKCKRKCRVM